MGSAGLNMKILVLNSGSSSLKFVLFKMSGEQVLISGTIDRIGISQSTVSFQESDKQPEVILGNIPDHGAALDTLFQVLTTGPVSDLMDIPSIAHRVAHGGKFRESVVITPEVPGPDSVNEPLFPASSPCNDIGNSGMFGENATRRTRGCL